MDIRAIYALSLVLAMFDGTTGIIFALLAPSFVDDITVLVGFFIAIVFWFVKRTGRFG
jgi:hypothetical protein